MKYLKTTSVTFRQYYLDRQEAKCKPEAFASASKVEVSDSQESTNDEDRRYPMYPR